MTAAALLLALAVLTWPPRANRRAPRLLHPWPTPDPRPSTRAEPPSRSRWTFRRRSARRQRDDDGTLAVLDRVAAGLRAGLPPGDALRAATTGGTSDGGFGAALRATSEGRSPAAALARAARTDGDEHLHRAARAWALSERTGAGLAEAIDAAARTGRQDLDHRRRVRAATAGARASVTLLTLLPVGGLGLALLLGLTPAQVYGNALSLLGLALGVVLLVVGRVVVSSMVRRVEVL